MRRLRLAGLVVASLAGARAEADPPANTLKDLYAALNRCVTGAPLTSGTDVTLMFMLNRKGALIGKPRLTHAIWPKDTDPRDAAADIASRFDHCLPLAITDALGGAIAGRLIAYRLRAAPPDQKA